jgi:lysozyme
MLVEAATGKRPIIYAGPAFFNALGNPQEFAEYPLFIANYDVTCPDIPPPWGGWTFWQSGDSSKVSGVVSDADSDVFNGSSEQLLQFARTGSY